MCKKFKKNLLENEFRVVLFFYNHGVNGLVNPSMILRGFKLMIIRK